MDQVGRRVLILSALLVLVAAGCGGKSAQGRVTTILFDLSGSTSAQAIRQQYMRDFTKVLDTVASGGVIAADIIDDNPLAHSTFPINESFDRYEPLKENKLDYERRVHQKRDAVLKQAEAIVRKPAGRPGSSVIDSMQLAERVFSTFEGDHKLLVDFSDMIEQPRRYDFTGENLTAARIGQIIAKEQSAGRLPELQDVEVCVVGAGAAASGGRSGGERLSIPGFLAPHFKTAGGGLFKELGRADRPTSPY